MNDTSLSRESALDNYKQEQIGSDKKKHLLAIAYHFPPVQGSTGVHRTLSFARYLADNNWRVTVLTVADRAYPLIDAANRSTIPENVRVIKCPAFDTSRHLAIRGKYFSFLAIPDKWQSWIPFGIIAALRVIRKDRPDVLWSTFPIASANFIALLLARMTRIPWIADFRDPMRQDDYPEDSRIRNMYHWLERKTVRHAQRIVTVTDGAAKVLRKNYPEKPATSIAVIRNGFDQSAFPTTQGQENGTGPGLHCADEMVVVHSGLLYPKERNPIVLFDAIKEMKDRGEFASCRMRIVFRGSGFDDVYSECLAQRKIGDIVKLKKPIAYRDAIQEMLSADALLVMQGASCNEQIPAKVYEYMNAGRPIIALTDRNGDTAQLLIEAGYSLIADLDDNESIKKMIRILIDDYSDVAANVPPRYQISKYSRSERGKELAELLADLLKEQKP